MDALILTSSLLVVIFTAVYLFFKYKYSYWSRQNVEFIPPKFPYGNIEGVGIRIHHSKIFQSYYKRMKDKGPICGLYFFTSPVALALDLDLIKNVLIRDFNYFQDHGLFYNERDDPLSAHLFALEGEKWKLLRQKLTPTFSTGKMKFMFPTVVEVAEKFHECLSTLIAENNELELKDLLARFTTDVIGTCVFGIDCNSLADPNAEFRAMGRNMLDVKWYSPLIQMYMATFMDFARALRMTVTPGDVSEFFLATVRETVEFREKKGVQRNDFINLLMEITLKERLGDDQARQTSINEIAAHAFVFFIAGFETSSTTMSYCLYELSLNMALQAEARHEIETVLNRHDGKFTYEAMMDMHLIDRIILESLRKYPPGANLIRKSTKAYKIPNSNITLEKGSLMMIPVYAIHHDAEYYPEPEVFDPNRFLPEEVKKRHNMSYLPFGEGPRMCVGFRFAIMQTHIGLITLLKNFEITTCSKSIVPLVFSNNGFVLSSKGGLFLKFTEIK